MNYQAIAARVSWGSHNIQPEITLNLFFPNHWSQNLPTPATFLLFATKHYSALLAVCGWVLKLMQNISSSEF